jgi:transcription antitermination factor NusB
MEKQHNRGQEGAGLGAVKLESTPGNEFIYRERAVGSSAISEIFSKVHSSFTAFSPEQLNDIEFVKKSVPYAAELFIGHLRYSTTGKSGLTYVHPLLRRNNWASRNLALAGNFNMTNVDEMFQQLLEEGQHPRDYADTFVMLESETYKNYSQIQAPTYDEDREFWRKVFKQFICGSEELYDLLEDECIYWNDDIEIIQSFVLKTIKRFNENKGADQPLLPMFKDEEDKEYALKLLHETILGEKKFRDLIEENTDKWDFERIAVMDLIIMQVALAEIFTFESIPTSVSLNEYIDIAKSYSTPKSGTFINGILDAIVHKIKNENLIFKN